MPERGRGVFCSWGALGLYGNNWKKMDILAPVGGISPGNSLWRGPGRRKIFLLFLPDLISRIWKSNCAFSQFQPQHIVLTIKLPKNPPMGV